MSLEEAHHHRRPWIRAWRKKEMNEGRGREGVGAEEAGAAED